MKLLADSSIWIDHIRQPNEQLALALRRGMIVTHPFVIGEVAMGSISRRAELLVALHQLRQVIRANDSEVLELIERRCLFGSGIGLVDAHLLAAAMLTPETYLWTRDRRLREAAERLEIAGVPGP